MTLVPYVGPQNSTIALVGEAPGKWEEVYRKPFVGRAGMALDRVLRRARLSRLLLRVCNVSRHRPRRGHYISDDFSLLWQDSKQTVPTTLLAEERDYLTAHLESLPNLKVIVALGRQPMYVLTGVGQTKSETITKYRGSILDPLSQVLRDRGVKIIPTFHPSFLTRMPSAEPIDVLDFLKAVRVSKEGVVDHQPVMNIYPTLTDINNYFAEGYTLGDNYPESVDIETAKGVITRIGFCRRLDFAISIPFVNIESGASAGNEGLWPHIKKYLQNRPILGQNFGSYDRFWLSDLHGIDCSGFMHDTMTAQHVILPGLPKMVKPVSLGFLTSVYTDMPFYKDEAKHQEGRTPTDEVYGRYNCKDVLATLEVAQKQLAMATFQRRQATFDFEFALNHGPIFDIMKRGIRVDEGEQQRLLERTTLEIEYLGLKACEFLGAYINLNSPKQIKDVLGIFTKESLKSVDEDHLKALSNVIKVQSQVNKQSSPLRRLTKLVCDIVGDSKVVEDYTKTGDTELRGVISKSLSGKKYTVNEGEIILNKLFQGTGFLDAKVSVEEVRQFIAIILTHRTAEQLRKGVLSAECDPDGRMRCTYKQETDTGRLNTGKSPYRRGYPLHTVPREKRIRSIFVADEGYTMTKRDLAQAEAWTTYYMAGATAMLERMKAGTKPHQLMASLISGKPYADVGKGTVEYEVGKRTVHSANYLVTGFTLSLVIKRELGIKVSRVEADVYIKQYYRLVPEVPRWHESVLATLKSGKPIINPFGRERVFWGNFGNDSEAHAILKQAVANLPQSTIGDLLNKIVLKWWGKHTCGQLLLLMHDETVTQAKHDKQEQHLKELDDAYNYNFEINGQSVVIPWDTTVCRNWGG